VQSIQAMVRHFDDVMYANCLQQQSQSAPPHHHQMVAANRQYPSAGVRGPATSSMYTGNTGCVDIAATSLSRSIHAVSDVDPMRKHRTPSPLQQRQHQAVYYTDFHRYHQQVGSDECVGIGPHELRFRGFPMSEACWATYPSTAVNDADSNDGCWQTSVEHDYIRADDSLDLLNHLQLQNRTSDDKTSHVFHSDRATAAVTTAADPSKYYHLQYALSSTADAFTVVTQRVIDDEPSQPHHLRPAGSTWTQSQPPFDWMRKQTFPAAVTPTGMRACIVL